MRNRRDVANRCNSKTNGLQRAQCRLSTRSGAFHFDLKGTDAMFGSLASRVLRAYLRGIGGRLTRTLETHHARGGPAYRIALGVGDGDHSVVEAGVHMQIGRACGRERVVSVRVDLVGGRIIKKKKKEN